MGHTFRRGGNADDVWTRNGIEHGETVQQICKRFAVRVDRACAHDRPERREPFGSMQERKLIGGARCVGQELANRRVGLCRSDAKRADAIVEREPPLLGAPQHHCCGNRLRQAIGVERGVRAGRQRAANVLPSVGTLPHHALGIDNGGSQTGYAGLVAQRIEIGPEDFVNDDLRLRRHAVEQQRGDEGGNASTAHLLAAIVPELSRFRERNFGGKLNCRIDIGAPHLNAVLEGSRKQRPRRNRRVEPSAWGRCPPFPTHPTCRC